MKLGKVIKEDNFARIKYHPLLASRNITKKSKSGKDVPINSIVLNEVFIDIDNNKAFTLDNDLIVEKLPVIRYALSSADSKVVYLVGNCVIKKNDFLKQLSFDSFKKKYLDNKKIKYNQILTDNSFIIKFRKIIESNMDLFEDILAQYNDDNDVNEIGLLITVKYNGETKLAHEFVECLNEIDEMFLLGNYVKDKGYVFTSAFYSMFNYGKYETNGVHTMNENSIPYFNKEQFLSLYYGKAIYSQTSYNFGDYFISIYPNYDNLTVEDIEALTFRGKDVFNFNLICDEIEVFINRKSERNEEERRLIPMVLTFDIYYRYELGKAGIQNMLRLTGVRYFSLKKIRDRINNEYYPTYRDGETQKDIKRKLFFILKDLYQDYNGKSDRYMTTITHTLENIYQNKFIVPKQADVCLLDRCEHLVRIGSPELRKTWNNLFNIFKFLKTMENKNYVSDLMNSSSYKLGFELAKFESGWKDDRKNLKKTIELFMGNISRRVYGVKDVMNYYTDLVERMKRNAVRNDEHNGLLFLLRTMTDIEFNKSEFIMGYFSQKNEYRPKTNNN